jgi:hypothetical protein
VKVLVNDEVDFFSGNSQHLDSLVRVSSLLLTI